MTTPDAALNAQYQSAANLQARIALHERFGTNSQSWQTWVFNQLALPATAAILEVGAGPGTLWRENLARIPAGWRITLTDRSPGMVAQAQATFAADDRFAFQVADVAALPFADASFDAVIANHMLYHVEPRPPALAEIRRVLRPGAAVYAATNGPRHLSEVVQLAEDFAATLDPPLNGTFYDRSVDYPFTLANGVAQLAPWFAHVEERRYHNDLAVTETDPVVAYLLSTMNADKVALTPEQIDLLRAHVAHAIAAGGGALHITRESGMFVAQRAGGVN